MPTDAPRDKLVQGGSMSYSPSYNIAIDQQNVVVRFNRDMIDRTALARFLDYLELESIRKRSQLTDAQAAELAAEIDQAVWNDLRQTFTGSFLSQDNPSDSLSEQR
jgi:hypothetical protein